MRKSVLLILCLMISFCVLSQPSVAATNVSLQKPPEVEYTLPYPGILPDHPLYTLKSFRDKILLLFTRNPIKKSQLQLLFSDKKLVMATKLLEKGKQDITIATLQESNSHLLTTVVILAQEKKSSSLPEGVLDKVELACKKHLEVIDAMILTISEETFRMKILESKSVINSVLAQISALK